MAMVDGAASLMTMFHGMHAAGQFATTRGANFLDGAAFFYDVYECADGEHIALVNVGPDNPVEFQDVVSTTQKLRPLAEATAASTIPSRDICSG